MTFLRSHWLDLLAVVGLLLFLYLIYALGEFALCRNRLEHGQYSGFLTHEKIRVECLDRVGLPFSAL